ncbi:MAG: acyl carrier protein [Magnetococcales bacterium]|nr:acyl carrier protein [Magnetococcales bacterium]
MNADEILVELTEIMRETFNTPSLEVNPGMNAKDVKGWDSLSNIRLIVSIEEHFNIRLSTSEVMQLQNIGSFIDLIAKKTA